MAATLSSMCSPCAVHVQPVCSPCAARVQPVCSPCASPCAVHVHLRTNEIVRVFPYNSKILPHFEWLWHKMLLGYTSGKLECRLAHARSLTRFRRLCFLVRGWDLGTRLVSIANFSTHSYKTGPLFILNSTKKTYVLDRL